MLQKRIAATPRARIVSKSEERASFSDFVSQQAAHEPAAFGSLLVELEQQHHPLPKRSQQCRKGSLQHERRQEVDKRAHNDVV